MSRADAGADRRKLVAEAGAAPRIEGRFPTTMDAAGASRRPPDLAVSPGEFLAEELKARRMSYRELAARSGLSPQLVRSMVAGTQPITAEMARGLERALGIPAAIWVRLEKAVDRARARSRARAP